MNGFLPLSRGDMEERGIKQFDFIYVTGDAYVDHPLSLIHISEPTRP